MFANNVLLMDRNISKIYITLYYIYKLFLGAGTRLSLDIKINLTLRNESIYDCVFALRIFWPKTC